MTREKWCRVSVRALGVDGLRRRVHGSRRRPPTVVSSERAPASSCKDATFKQLVQQSKQGHGRAKSPSATSPGTLQRFLELRAEGTTYVPDGCADVRVSAAAVSLEPSRIR